MPKKLLTTGQFAELCKTSKDTILYYDKLGLLKPVFVGSNKYRYYSIFQYCVFDRIKVLQDTGYSLEEISKSNEFDHATYLGLVDTLLQETTAKRKSLELKENMLRVIKEQLQENAHAQLDCLTLQELGAQKYLTLVLDPPFELTSMEDFIYQHQRFIGKIVKQGNNYQIILGGEMDLQLLPKCVLKQFICTSEVVDATGYGELEIEAGLYACLYHKDNFEGHVRTINQTVEKLRLEHQLESLKIYVFDLYSIFSNDIQGESYVTKYLIHVGPAKSAKPTKPAKPANS